VSGLHEIGKIRARGLKRAEPGAAGGFLLAARADRASNPLLIFKGRSIVATGTVKWFNGQKGYGFIQPDTGGKDVFVHISAFEKAGMDGLPDGAKITYDIISDRGKESAGNLHLR
jgi:CspA family cold shock protein